MAHDVISRRPNNSVVVSGITDIAGPADGFVLVENGPKRHFVPRSDMSAIG
jgi:hypothetical protein